MSIVVINTLYYAFTDEEAVQIDFTIGIVAPLIILVLIAVLFSIIVAVVVMKSLSRKRSKFSLWQISITD